MRRLPSHPALRALEVLSLWLFVKSSVLLIARFALGYRHRFELSFEGRALLLVRERVIWGASVRRRRTLLPVDRFQEVTLETDGESPSFVVGLAALVLGTFFGARLLVEGARAAGGASSLLGIGCLLIALSLALDFFVGSGRKPRDFVGKTQLALRVAGQRGWVLAGLDPTSARELTLAIQRALVEGGDLQAPALRESPTGPETERPDHVRGEARDSERRPRESVEAAVAEETAVSEETAATEETAEERA